MYNLDHEHDGCGVGFIANVNGERSYSILDRAITGLKNLAHRGAIDADAVTGDGAGIITQIPYKLIREFLESKNKKLYNNDDLGVAVVFLPLNNDYEQARAKHNIEESIKSEGLNFLTWREVPIDETCLGKKAELTRPKILQALFARNSDDDAVTFERKCFLVMKTAEKKAISDNLKDFYIVSCSSKTITYKGLLNAPQVRKFFLDLRSDKFETAFVIFHQRFATNTFPDWTRAQPYRMLAHNGEINTIRGNRNLMRAREYSTSHGVWGDRYSDLQPFIQTDMSDSASFDNAFHLINVGGRSCIHAISMMMPCAWEKGNHYSEEARNFFRYHSTVIEPWDGPAAIVFTDGRYIGAALDRNGLRPMRYKVYEDGTVIIASEVGVIPEWGSPIVKNGRLGPGRTVAIDLQEKMIYDDPDVKDYIGSVHDYGSWCSKYLCNLHEISEESKQFDKFTINKEKIDPYQIAFGYDLDEREIVLAPMAKTGAEPIGSMGDDTPLAVLSRRPRLLYTYAKQLFAQVTNPAIDPIRETLVMSLNMYLGGRIGLFEEMPEHRKIIALETPILFENEFNKLFKIDFLTDKIVKLDVTFDSSKGPDAMEPAINELRRKAHDAVEVNGALVIVLSDRNISQNKVAIPMLLAVGAIHQELVRAGLRLKADIVCDTGEARDVHQMACLLGFGANAIFPYLAYDVIKFLVSDNKELEGLNNDTAILNYRKALEKGLLKIMSKMGISTLFSYRGAQIFEFIGLSDKLVEECFFGSPSPIGGISYRLIADESLRRHLRAFPETGESDVEVVAEGYYKVIKRGDGEFHSWNPKVVAGMNRFVKKPGDIDAYNNFKKVSEEHTPVTIKDLLKIRYPDNDISLDDVEPIEDIRRRFTTAGMSLGALSPEAHECLAIAMNRIGGKSNSGEGGEDPERFNPRPNGDHASSAIKQIASGRFGLTAEYLANAKELEIKIAQGAKPGEGGQLPGHKVSEMIARLRYSVPGVTLISPPPHHDIYSIEDLAQLIFDLKEVNPRAKVCVKLVSCSGIGTIATGVAKAYADVILISGHDGGTGASPVSSIKNAGSAWEIGLSEVHQILMMNDLRGRVTLRTDGGLKTGRDIIIAAILGAEEYNFGTAAMIAASCAMFRVCHLNTCPVGVATQREDLRGKFKGKPENVINFFNAVAEDVRRHLSKLGFRTIDEIIGRTELLEQIYDPGNAKSKMINFKGILHNPDPSGNMDRYHTRNRNDRFGNDGSLDDEILQEVKDVIQQKVKNFKGSYKIKNTNRDVGTHISGEIAYLLGNRVLSPGAIDLTFTGSAGQSFGTFLVQGLRLNLLGDSNDYVGKGMNAGEIIVRPRECDEFVWHENIIIGNTCLYGATGGYLFAAGRAGERFAVRNSGATSVVAGVGDHGCEYMTGGCVVILGRTGRNFGAGMSGGTVFVYDDEDKFDTRYNPEMIDIERIDQSDESESVRKLVDLHFQLTTDPRAKELLDNWHDALSKFWKVVPKPSSPGAAKFEFKFGLDLQAIAV